MPRTVSFPSPSATRCPICAADLDRPACPSCGAVFASADGGTLWQVDHDLADLCRIRNDVVGRLLTDAAARAVAPVEDPLDRLLTPPPASAPTAPPATEPRDWRPPAGPPPVPPMAARPPRREWSVAELLVGLGALSLVAAVVVFAAVTWSDLAAWAQGGLIVAATGAMGALAVGCRRRGLAATAESLGAVTVALALADVHVARVGLGTPPRASWALGLAVVAGVGVVAGRRVGVRTFSLAGAALALAPVPVALSDAGPTVVAAGLAVQALVAAVVAGRRPAGADDGPAVTAVAVVGAVGSWVAAAGLAAGVAVVDLLAVPTRAPVAAAAVLAGLAAGSVALARLGRLPAGGAAALAGAGALLAFVPVPLVVVATGSAEPVVGVVVAQALVAVGLLSGRRLSEGEAPAVLGAAVTTWVAGAVGAALLAAHDLGDGRAPWAGAALLGALAVGSVAGARRAASSASPDANADDPSSVVGGGLPGLGAAGTAVAFLPGLLLAASAGASTVVAVAAAEGLVAGAGVLLGSRWLRDEEATVARALGAVTTVAGSLGALSLALAAVDDGGLAGRVVPVTVLGVVAAALVAVGRRADRPGLMAVGCGVALAPAPLAVAGLGPSSLLAWVLLAQAVVLAGVASRVVGPARGVVRLGVAASWAGAMVVAGLVGVSGWLASPVVHPAGAVAALVAGALVAVGVALRGGWERDLTGAALAAAVAPLVAAGALAADAGPDGRVTAALVVAAAVGALAAVARRVDDGRPWVAAAATALATGAVLAVSALDRVLEVVALLAGAAVSGREGGADVAVAEWLWSARLGAGVDALPGWTAVGQLAALAVLAGVLTTVHRRAGAVALVGTGLAALVLVPVVAGSTVGVTVAGLVVVLVAVAEALRRHPRTPEGLVAGAAVAALGLGVALAAPSVAVGWTVLAVALLLGLTVLRVAAGDGPAPWWAVVAAGAVVGSVALDAGLLDLSADGTGAALAVTAVVMAVVGGLAARQGAVGRSVASVVDGGVVVAATVGLARCRSVDGATVVLALAAAAAAVTAVRPERRAAAVVAGALAVVVAWLRLGQAEVGLVEAYTLPVAAWALGVGAFLDRGRGSWARFGAALVVAVGPTAVLALVEPSPVRTVAVVGVGTVLVVVGSVRRLQAPVAVGGVALGAVAVRHLAPVVAAAPRSLALAVAGLVLLAVGATFEQRRRDVRQVRDSFGRLS